MCFCNRTRKRVGTVKQLFDSVGSGRSDLLHLVHKREYWGEGYLWQPEGKGGVIRLVPDPFSRWLVSQNPDEKAAREKLTEDEYDNLGKAVAELAWKYPAGLPRGVTV